MATPPIPAPQEPVPLAKNQDGKVVNVNDRVSIGGTVVSFTGAGSIALVTVQPLTSIVNFVAQANDMQARQGSSVADLCTSISGKAFGNANDSVTVLGVVTAITNPQFGNQAVLTVTLCTSGLSINVNAGSVRSDNF
jgi:hypothetical protein